MLNLREAALSGLKEPRPRLFRARDDSFLFSADASFLGDGWVWPENRIFEAIPRGKAWLLRLTDEGLSTLGVPGVSAPAYDGTARAELLRLIAAHPGPADRENAFLFYALWKAKEAGSTEETCARLLPAAARLINARHPLPACAAELL